MNTIDQRDAMKAFIRDVFVMTDNGHVLSKDDGLFWHLAAKHGIVDIDEDDKYTLAEWME